MAWYDSAWKYRFPIAVDYTKVGAVLTDFPVYVSGANFPAAFWTRAQATGADIRITLADGTTLLSHELVHFAPGSAAMELHFKAPSLSNVTNTTFYIYYGNAAASAPSAASQRLVWSNGYVGVWHLGESAAGTGTAGVYKNSVADLYNGDDYVDPGGKTGQLYPTGGETWDGVDDYIECASIGGSYTALNISIWTNMTGAYSGFHSFIAQRNGVDSLSRFYIRSNNATGVLTTQMFNNAGDGDSNTGVAAMGAGPHLVVGDWDGANVRGYLDGVALGGAIGALTGTISPTGVIRFGRDAVETTHVHNSWLDEARISSVSRAATWLTTEHANQNASATFYSAGAEQAGRRKRRLWLPPYRQI